MPRTVWLIAEAVAFLYEHVRLGKAGKDWKVIVVDDGSPLRPSRTRECVSVS
jgi:hypothetical protein